MNEHERRMVEAINAARGGRGLPALAWAAELGAAARRHAADLAAHPGLMHDGSDGSTIDSRMRDAGYQPLVWREVVGWGFRGDVGAMLDWWLASPGHVSIVLDGDVREMGVGYVHAPETNWGHYWCVDFGRRAEMPQPPPPPPRPRPYSSYAPVVVGAPTPAAATFDLVSYMRGDGRTYRVGNSWGSFEVFQTQVEGDRFYQVKAWDDLSVVNWEEFVVTDGYIGRDVDTSPGGGRFYRQFGAPWVKRHMRVGESFSQGKRVQFYRSSDCAPLGTHSGQVVDTITLVEHLAEWRSPFGVAVPDVVVLRWEEGGEAYRFGRGWGLVGWERRHQDSNSPVWSGVAEMRPGVGKLARLAIPCL
jgi:hypothetical protein